MLYAVRNGVGIVLNSLKFIKNNKTVLLIDLLGNFVFILWTGAIFLPMYFMEDFFFGDESASIAPIIASIVFLFGAVFIYMFFQAMILSFTFNSLKGRKVSWSSSFKQASQAWFGILCWSFVECTVGIFLGKSRRGRSTFSTFTLSGIWRILTIMVLPVILFEKVGLKGTVKRAAELFRASWGENISGNLGIGLFYFIAVFGGSAVIALIMYLFKLSGIMTVEQVKPFIMTLCYIYGIFLAILMSSVNAVFDASIYYYAVEKEHPPIYESGLIDRALTGY